MVKDLLNNYKKKIYGDLYILFSKELKKIAIEFKLDHEELVKLYLSDLKKINN
jgi:hypothetical protein